MRRDLGAYLMIVLSPSFWVAIMLGVMGAIIPGWYGVLLMLIALPFAICALNG